MKRTSLSKRDKNKDKLFVTTGDYTPKGYRVVKSIDGMDWDNVEGIIFNESKDDDFVVLSELSNSAVREKLKFIIYVNSDLKPVFYGLFSGMNADIYGDSSLLEDEQILDFIVAQYGQNKGLTVKSPSQNFADLNRSLERVLRSDEKTASGFVANKVWRKTVSESLAVIDTTLARADQINSEMVQVIGKAKENSDKLIETNKSISEQLEALNNTMSNFADGVVASPMIYSPYKVSSATKKVMFIKCFSHCTYLMSFLIAYQKYLRQTKMLDSRILLVLPNLSIFTARYQKIPRLATETLGTMMNMHHNLYCTFEPKREILNKFFDGNNMLYIIVDEMYTNSIIGPGAKVEKFSAVSSLSDIERFGIDVKRTFFPIVSMNGGFNIPYIENYSEKYKTDAAKLSAYFGACKYMYARLDKIFDIK